MQAVALQEAAPGADSKAKDRVKPDSHLHADAAPPRAAAGEKAAMLRPEPPPRAEPLTTEETTPTEPDLGSEWFCHVLRSSGQDARGYSSEPVLVLHKRCDVSIQRLFYGRGQDTRGLQ